MSFPIPGFTRGGRGAAHNITFPKYYRLKTNSVIGGVCSGLAAHLGVDVTWVRLSFTVLMSIPLFTFPTYMVLWLFADSTDSADTALTTVARQRAQRSAPGVRGMDSMLRAPSANDWLLLAICTALVGMSLLINGSPVTVGLTVAVVGVLLVWQTFGAQQSALKPMNRGWQFVSLIGGIVLLIAGATGAFVLGFGTNAVDNSSVLARAFLVVMTLMIGLVVVLVPLWLQLWSRAHRRALEQAAENERAEIASRIHDSVLQTLTIIQKNSREPEIVTAARSQERQLRQWLFGVNESVAPETLFGALRVACGEVEDLYGVRVRPVMVGLDRPTDDALLALVLAGREAMVNAAKHSGCEEINVFMDAGEDAAGTGAADADRPAAEAGTSPHPVELYVRDRGPGFDVGAIPEDRQGVRQSIIARVERAGGSVVFDSGPQGTEVMLTMPGTTR